MGKAVGEAVNEAGESTASAPVQREIPLQPLADFLASQPEIEQSWRVRSSAVVAHHPHKRWRISVETLPEIGFGLWRDEMLAERGVSSVEGDVREFASGFVAAMADELSIHDLRLLTESFQRELSSALRRREIALSKYKEQSHE
jgi:hypothetical protein